MTTEYGRSGAVAPSGCQPSASAAEEASSQSGIPNADRRAAMLQRMDQYLEAMWQEAARDAGMAPMRWMMSPDALRLLSVSGERPQTYRRIRIEEHDEWAWGWMLRSYNGSFIELPASCDRSGEADETALAGSAEGESAVPEGETPK